MRQTVFTLVTVLAVHAPGSAEPTLASISVKPVLCIVDERTPTCSPNFEITWQATRLGDYCVLNENDDEPLRCWSESLSGGTTYESELTESTEFRLEEGEAGTLVASATVDVLRKDSDDRRRRRRTRYVWDVM